MTSLLVAAALGLMARLVLAWYTVGTNDALIWLEFAKAVNETGLLEVYRADPIMNHPPLPAEWAALCARAADASGLSFWFLFKLPVIAADAVACALLADVWGKRGGSTLRGRVAAVAFAWNLDSILVSGFHCNTDPAYATLALLAAWFVAERRNYLAAGLALAAAVNVKIIPVLLVPPFLSLCRDRRDAARLLAGLAVGALPFVPPLALAGRAFLGNVLGYNSILDRWGVPFALESMGRAGGPLLDFYRTAGRFLIVGAVLALSAASWRGRGRRWDAYQLSAATLGLFLVLAPGFGVQYTVIVAPLLLAVGLRIGTSYGLVAGTFLLVVYGINWTGTMPAVARFRPRLPMAGALVGAVAWALLVGWLARLLAVRRPKPGVEASS